MLFLLLAGYIPWRAILPVRKNKNERIDSETNELEREIAVGIIDERDEITLFQQVVCFYWMTSWAGLMALDAGNDETLGFLYSGHMTLI